MRPLSAAFLLYCTVALSTTAVNASDNTVILLEDFSNPQHKWVEMNDPVMGGKSYSSVEIERGVAAKFTGYCAIVPSLNAPGFVTMSTG